MSFGENIFGGAMRAIESFDLPIVNHRLEELNEAIADADFLPVVTNSPLLPTQSPETARILQFPTQEFTDTTTVPAAPLSEAAAHQAETTAPASTVNDADAPLASVTELRPYVVPEFIDTTAAEEVTHSAAQQQPMVTNNPAQEIDYQAKLAEIRRIHAMYGGENPDFNNPNLFEDVA